MTNLSCIHLDTIYVIMGENRILLPYPRANEAYAVRLMKSHGR